MSTNTSPSDPRGPEPAGVSAVLAVVLATISCFALTIFGLGMLSVLTDRDIIAVPGLGPVPGVAGMVVAMGAFAATLGGALKRGRPSFVSVPVIGLSTALAHLIAVWMTVLMGAGDFVVATVVAGDLIRGGASLVLLAAASIAGWGGIALRRTRAQHPQWPWEPEDPDDG